MSFNKLAVVVICATYLQSSNQEKFEKDLYEKVQLQVCNKGWGVTGQLTHPKFLKTCSVVWYNNKLQSFCPSENISRLWVCAVIEV